MSPASPKSPSALLACWLCDMQISRWCTTWTCSVTHEDWGKLQQPLSLHRGQRLAFHLQSRAQLQSAAREQGGY